MTLLITVTTTLLLLVSIQTAGNGAQSVTVADDAFIKLERTPCGGECPVYVVTIDARGNVTCEGSEYVRVKGRQTDRIPVAHVAQLLDTARRIRFFELADRYRSIKNDDGTETIVTDLPTTFVTITEGGQSKRVDDYVGAPEGLRQLEGEIDELARTKRWTFLDEAMIQQLVAEGWAPGQDELRELLVKAVQRDEQGVVKGLVDLGADVNGATYSATTPLMFARSAATARLLLAAGADPNARSESGATPLGMSVYDAPGVAEELLKRGARVDEPFDSDGHTPLWRAACAGNAGVVRLLLAAGANPMGRVSGRTALDLAKEQRTSERFLKPLPLGDRSPYAKDFDAVIALLEQAVARRRMPQAPLSSGLKEAVEW
jgi:hypothetical protein